MTLRRAAFASAPLIGFSFDGFCVIPDDRALRKGQIGDVLIKIAQRRCLAAQRNAAEVDRI